jgi:hypothetical protein
MLKKVISLVCVFILVISLTTDALSPSLDYLKENSSEKEQSQKVEGKVIGEEETDRFIIKFKTEEAGRSFKSSAGKSLKSDTKEIKETKNKKILVYTANSDMKPQDLMTMII